MKENKIERITYYLDSHDTEFSIGAYSSSTYPIHKVRISIRDNSSLIFNSKEKVDELCELLQNKKNEIWK